MRLSIHRAVREIAATTIQSAVRGHRARAKVVALRDRYLQAEAEEAACVIQMAVMEWLLRMRNAKETHSQKVRAATVIQSNVRGWLLRQQQWRLIEEDMELERELQRQRDLQVERLPSLSTPVQSMPVQYSGRSVGANSFRSTVDGEEPTPRELRLRQHLDAIRRARQAHSSLCLPTPASFPLLLVLRVRDPLFSRDFLDAFRLTQRLSPFCFVRLYS